MPVNPDPVSRADIFGCYFSETAISCRFGAAKAVAWML
jgi:hypothetical protein